MNINKYFYYEQQTNMETMETMETITPDPENDFCMIKSLITMKVDMRISKVVDDLRKDEKVDNIWVGYKVPSDWGPRNTYAVVTYHKYNEDETPSCKDPNRIRTWIVSSTEEVSRIHKQYGSDVEAYTEAVLNGIE